MTVAGRLVYWTVHTVHEGSKAYGKIFTQIYDGSLYGQWEALVTFQQLIVLSNKDGEVDMTPQAIAARTSIPLDIITRGLEQLAAPDERSRTPDEQGRRIVLLDTHRNWGWRIVNFAKYRDIRSAEERREYFREWKRAKRQEAAGAKKPRREAGDDTAFDAFWNAYPKKVAKPAALKAWKAAKLANGDCDAVMGALAAFRDSADWQKNNGQFIPHPATWLNGKRWLDKIERPPEPFPI